MAIFQQIFVSGSKKISQKRTNYLVGGSKMFGQWGQDKLVKRGRGQIILVEGQTNSGRGPKNQGGIN